MSDKAYFWLVVAGLTATAAFVLGTGHYPGPEGRARCASKCFPNTVAGVGSDSCYCDLTKEIR